MDGVYSVLAGDVDIRFDFTSIVNLKIYTYSYIYREILCNLLFRTFAHT